MRPDKPPATELSTTRMRLRRFESSDVPALVALDRDPLVRRYVEDGEPVTEATAIARVAPVPVVTRRRADRPRTDGSVAVGREAEGGVASGRTVADCVMWDLGWCERRCSWGSRD